MIIATTPKILEQTLDLRQIAVSVRLPQLAPGSLLEEGGHLLMAASARVAQRIRVRPPPRESGKKLA